MKDRIKNGEEFDETKFYQAVNAKDVSSGADSADY
jgi:hypothetical protein